MKKVLLGSVAAAAALAMASAPASADDKIKLGLGGYFAGFAAFVDDDAAGARDFAFGHDSEVHFKGSTSLENGLKISFKAELELEDDSAADNSDADSVDEIYIDVKGAFGKIRFGQEDGVSSSMRIKTPTPFLRIGADDVEDVELLNDSVGDQLETELGDDDSTKIIYNTPRLGGFQAGISYAPEKGKNKQGLNSRVESDGDEMLEVGVNYKGEFNDVDFGAAFVVFTDDRTTDSAEHFNASLSLGVGGFTFGGNYTWGDNLKVDGAKYSSDYDATIWSLGGVYKNGPWKFGAQYFSGEEDAIVGTTTNDYTSYLGGINYTVGPKITLGLGVLHADDDSDNQDGTTVFVETGLKF